MITDISIIKTTNLLFLIIFIFFFDYVLCGPKFPFKRGLIHHEKVKDYYDKHELRVHDHLPFKI